MAIWKIVFVTNVLVVFSIRASRIEITATAGDTTELPCVETKDSTLSTNWILPNDTIVYESDPMVKENGTLQIRDTKLSDEGWYFCFKGLLSVNEKTESLRVGTVQLKVTEKKKGNRDIIQGALIGAMIGSLILVVLVCLIYKYRCSDRSKSDGNDNFGLAPSYVPGSEKL